MQTSSSARAHPYRDLSESWDPAHARLTGTQGHVRIGRFVVQTDLGAGAMGEVYLCHDERLRRDVAVKLMLAPDRARNHVRLPEEARALARLAHPHITQVYAIGVHELRALLVMEYIAGQTLREWLDAGPPFAAVLDCFIGAGRGLAAIHRAALVHSDFKPENVLVCADGIACIVDFGLATDAAPRDGERAPDPAGTPAYMAPEQGRGGDVDARGDQYAFCVALAEVLRRRASIRGLSLARRWRISRVIRGGTSLDPNDRWSDMDTLLGALRRRARPVIFAVATKRTQSNDDS